MSYCKQIGKDRIIFATKEDHSQPSNVQFKTDDSNIEPKGLILENGEINWNCPCLGGMASGPCGYQFREAFNCFHFSSAEQKGSECMEKFEQMSDCMSQYPNLYPKSEQKDFDVDEDITDDSQPIKDKLSQLEEQKTNDTTVSNQQKI